MTNVGGRRWVGPIILAVTTFCLRGQVQRPEPQQMQVILVGFADRWADYGARGDTPSFRDFLAIKSPDGASTNFVKLRFLYWPQDKKDPKDLAKLPAHTENFEMVRDSSCDEAFSSLSRRGAVSYLDPELRPSRFVFLPRSNVKRPHPDLILPCYEVK